MILEIDWWLEESDWAKSTAYVEKTTPFEMVKRVLGEPGMLLFLQRTGAQHVVGYINLESTRRWKNLKGTQAYTLVEFTVNTLNPTDAEYQIVLDLVRARYGVAI